MIGLECCRDYFASLPVLVQKELFSDIESKYIIFEEEERDASPDFLKIWQFSPNVNFVLSHDLADLIISGYGVSLSKKSERLLIREDKKAVFEIPLFRLKSICICSRGVNLSSDIIQACAQNGINIFFYDFADRPYAVFQTARHTPDIALQRRQLELSCSEKSGELAKIMISGKITNQKNFLKYACKNMQDDIGLYRDILQKVGELESLILKISDIPKGKIDDVRGYILGIEGSAAKIYWYAYGLLLRNGCRFMGRMTKHLSKDIVNALLNYGYAMLYNQVWGVLLEAGLSPYAGFVHTDADGKLSLVYDMSEEFRTVIVDRTVLPFINSHSELSLKDGMICDKDRNYFAKKILERMNAAERFAGKKFPLSYIISAQAYNLGKYIMGKRAYKPFSFKW